MEQLSTDSPSPTSQSPSHTLLPHKALKDQIKPYRKYQCTILLLIIIMFTLISILSSLNKSLNTSIHENESLTDTLSSLQSDLEISKMQQNRIFVSYKHIYNLDQGLNSDIIRNIEELSMISRFISTYSAMQYTLCYKATVDGDKAEKFRENCSGISPLLVLIETEHGHRFGGYTTRGFTDEKEETSYKWDDNAFLFSFDTQKKYDVEIPDKAISDVVGQFPIFGKNDIYIVDNFFSNSNSVTEYPSAYKEDPNAPGDYVLNGGIKKFKIKELEVLICFFNIDDGYENFDEQY